MSQAIIDQDEFLRRLPETDVGKALLQQFEREREEQRRALLNRRDAARSALDRETPPLLKKVAAAQAACDKQREALRDAERTLAAAENDLRQATHPHEAVITRCDSEARALAAPQIDAFIRELRELHAKYRSQPPVIDFEEEQVDRNWVRRHALSNTQGIAAVLERTRECLEQAEQLKVTVVDDVEAEIVRLRESIPLHLVKLERI
jgi:hypothetical protein